MVGVGLSLDPDERKRLLVRGSSFALKNRDRSFLDFQFFWYFIPKIEFFRQFFFFNIHQLAPRGEVICDHRMLHCLDLFAAEISFSMMFKY